MRRALRCLNRHQFLQRHNAIEGSRLFASPLSPYRINRDISQPGAPVEWRTTVVSNSNNVRPRLRLAVNQVMGKAPQNNWSCPAVIGVAMTWERRDPRDRVLDLRNEV